MKLTPLLTDHAVVQRRRPIPVWGWTEPPRTRVRATLGATCAEGISGDDGRFLLRLPPQEAGGPLTLVVETLDGSERSEVYDIMIGEVWLASGQSNMEWTLANSEYREVISQAHAGQIRMFTVARRAELAPQSTVCGRWERSGPDTAGQFSAVAAFFGNRLQEELGIPVGIISASWGGSFIETWISRERLLATPLTREWVRAYEAFVFTRECWSRLPENFLPADPGNTGVANGWHRPDCDDHDWETMPLPGTWQEHGHNYSAVMWFRRRIALPPHLIGQALTLHLGAVDKHDITYAGGREIGRTGEGFDETVYAQNRCYTIPAEATQTGEVVVAVRAYSFAYAGGLTGPAEAMRLTLEGDESGTAILLSGDWRFRVEHNFGFIDLTLESMGHGNHNSPYMCFDNMIRPLLPIEQAGVIWYQGESNAGKPAAYQVLLQALIADWRAHLAPGEDLPFGIVQLPNYLQPQPFQADSNWAGMREAQAAALTLPGTGLAVIIDSGEAGDIHPRNKQPVGYRLAQWALAEVYGQAITAGSPLYSGHSIEGNRIRITFRNTGSGLALTEGDQVRTLVIAGADGRFAPAESALEGDSLLVWHAAIPAPQHVRYAWADNPEAANLVNSDGFPAGPFRTDTP